METEKREQTDGRAPRSRLERTRQRTAAIQARAHELEQRARAERGRHASVDAAFEMVERDGEVGGGIIAGALAYRFFIWLLPLALVAVVGLGIAADASSVSPQKAAESIGLAGLVSNSVATAAKSSTRWYALLVGVPVLLWTTRSLLRATIAAHRLVWADVRSAVQKPKTAATLTFLGLLLCLYLVTGLAGAVRVRPGGVLGVLATLLMSLPYAGLWLLVTTRLPHRGTSWLTLVPGALLFGLGIELLHLVIAYVIGPYAIAKRGTYGAFGAAAALLLGLYLISRLIVASAVVNATLWKRRAPPG